MAGGLEWLFYSTPDSFCRTLNRSKKSYLYLFTSVESTECRGQLMREGAMFKVCWQILTHSVLFVCFFDIFLFPLSYFYIFSVI